MRQLGLSLSEDEENMGKFISNFGGKKDPEEFAEYLFDYYENPQEYGISSDSEYYDQIIDFYKEIENCSRFNLRGPMRVGTSKRWDETCIESSDVYKRYKKMSSY
jgi:hypothetical protein